MNPLFMTQQINALKKKYSDPNKAIQELLNSGRVTQSQYDAAVKQAQKITGMLPPSVRR